MNTTIEHLTDASFDKEIEGSPIPVLVDYWAEWCTPCRMMDPVIDALSEAYAGRLKVVKVNADENPTVASRYRVRSIPTLMLFQGGQAVGSRIGTQSKAQLAEFVDASLAELSPA